ncbi:MAG: hypothetical protein HY719_01850, partial [Planctomycetes bacterium]|nr:hypothetical protein [Planctomycetota bacterium]
VDGSGVSNLSLADPAGQIGAPLFGDAGDVIAFADGGAPARVLARVAAALDRVAPTGLFAFLCERTAEEGEREEGDTGEPTAFRRLVEAWRGEDAVAALAVLQQGLVAEEARERAEAAGLPTAPAARAAFVEATHDLARAAEELRAVTWTFQPPS